MPCGLKSCKRTFTKFWKGTRNSHLAFIGDLCSNFRNENAKPPTLPHCTSITRFIDTRRRASSSSSLLLLFTVWRTDRRWRRVVWWRRTWSGYSRRSYSVQVHLAGTGNRRLARSWQHRTPREQHFSRHLHFPSYTNSSSANMLIGVSYMGI